MLDSRGAPRRYWTWVKGFLSSDMWVGIGVLAAIFFTYVAPKLFENDQGSLNLYQVNSDRFLFSDLKVTSDKLGEFKATLTSQVEYLLVNKGNRPIEANDYVDPITVRGQDDVYVLRVSSRLLNNLKPIEWNSDDGVFWKMTPEFLNPGDRISITIFAAAVEKDKWEGKNIGDGLEWAGRIRGTFVGPQVVGGYPPGSMIVWQLSGLSSVHSDGGLLAFLVLVAIYYFGFMWFLFPQIENYSLALKIIVAFLLVWMAFVTADGTHYILCPRVWDAGRTVPLTNWLCVLAPITVVGLLTYILRRTRDARKGTPTMSRQMPV